MSTLARRRPGTRDEGVLGWLERRDGSLSVKVRRPSGPTWNGTGGAESGSRAHARISFSNHSWSACNTMAHSSPGSIDREMGCCVARSCPIACLVGRVATSYVAALHAHPELKPRSPIARSRRSPARSLARCECARRASTSWKCRNLARRMERAYIALVVESIDRMAVMRVGVRPAASPTSMRDIMTIHAVDGPTTLTAAIVGA